MTNEDIKNKLNKQLDKILRETTPEELHKTLCKNGEQIITDLTKEWETINEISQWLQDKDIDYLHTVIFYTIEMLEKKGGSAKC